MAAEEVARNQRERLFGAMVASVSQRGYAATRLSDLVDLSGVARKSFYALFADKEECFVGAVRAGLETVVPAAGEPSGTWEQQVRSATAAFARLLVEQPAMARLLLIEAYAVGPAALAPIEAATARFEAQATAAAVAAGQQGDDLTATIAAQVGALIEIARERLRLGTESELPGLAAEFAELALGHPAPPQPLRLASRPPRAAPETLNAHGHVERVLRAFAAVVAERGYGETTIELVLKRASMSPKTFYASFASKEDVLAATIESAGLQLLAAILPSFHRNPVWTQGVRAAFGDFFNFLASRPALARLLLVEVYGAGPAALERRAEALRPLEVLLAEGRARSEQLTPLTLEALAGGIYQLAYKQVRAYGTEALPALAPICTYLTLTPLVGPVQACTVANGDGSGRGGSDPDRLIRSRVRMFLNTGEANAETIARELGLPLETVRDQLGDLEAAGLLAASETALGDGTEETVYRANTDFIDDDRWEQMGLAERQRASRQVANLLNAEIDQAIELGTFDARVDRHLSRMPLLVDERGWRELLAIHARAFYAATAVAAESAERLQRNGSRGIPGSSVQALFEVPTPPY